MHSFDRHSDTIYALASGRLPSAIAIVRVSGPQVQAVLQGLCGVVPPARRAASVRLRDPVGGQVIDHALALYFAAPASATGDDVAEFHVHGGTAIVAALLRAIGSIEGCRAARAGEFTQRAFINGKLDLAQVEAVADLIAATSERQLEAAMSQYSGTLARQAGRWKAELVAALSLIEAMIEFPDEEEAQGIDVTPILRRIGALQRDFENQVRLAGQSERIRQGVVVAIVGAPNVGKSSLLNILAGRDAAIVTEIAGTTRDPIEVDISIGGLPVRLIDTAGLRETSDPVEREGIARAEQVMARAEIILHLRDVSAPERAPAQTIDSETKQIVVYGKADLHPKDGRQAGEVWISCKTGEGINDLLDSLGRQLNDQITEGESGVLCRDRHIQAVLSAARELDSAAELLQRGQPEIASHHMSIVIKRMDELIGLITSDDILDKIFRDFCIGK